MQADSAAGSQKLLVPAKRRRGGSDAGKEKYDPQYNDEEADIILVSSDGVKFRVHSYYLKAVRYA